MSIFKKRIRKYNFYNSDCNNHEKETQPEKMKVFEEANTSLSQMIGLTKVKDQLNQYFASVRAKQMRKELGITNVNDNNNYHMVFFGNPGTGKTECARLCAKALYGLNIVPVNNFNEASRIDLVGDGSVTPAHKTYETFMKSMPGILFIDEAYSLCYGPDDSLGKEAVDTLLKLMEDYRDMTIVIFAGYTNEMNQFLQVNPGLKSRIPETGMISFEDYSIEELNQIFHYMIRKDGYKDRITNEDKLNKTIMAHLEKGNARDVRNLWELTKRNLDLKCINQGQIEKDFLITITDDLLP